jgi:transcriptional regulator with XRE-family HTH domain
MEKGLSQAELAAKIRGTTKTVSDIENGKKEVTPRMALRLEKAFGVGSYKGTRYRFHVVHTNGPNSGVFAGFQKIGYQEGIPRYPHSKTKFFFEVL